VSLSLVNYCKKWGKLTASPQQACSIYQHFYVHFHVTNVIWLIYWKNTMWFRSYCKVIKANVWVWNSLKRIKAILVQFTKLQFEKKMDGDYAMIWITEKSCSISGRNQRFLGLPSLLFSGYQGFSSQVGTADHSPLSSADVKNKL
jgi:uncharacterized protein with PQ loop repeat